MSEYHIPVLINEVLDVLQITNGKQYIDATLGGGGHTQKILESGGVVLGIDADEDAIEHVQEKFKVQNSKFKIGEDASLIRGNFKDIQELAKQNGFENVAGILFDLGVSSHQLDTGERGFSFRMNAPLDMRMDKTLAVTAADLINGLTEKELYELFTKLGEESYARAISKSVVRARRVKPITTTGELAQLISMVKGRSQGIHPATQVFQALRMAVNGELENIREGLKGAIEILDIKGRIAVISFHSLEDRIIKQTFQEFEDKKMGRIITHKPIMATDKEIEENPRSRSAKLRVFEKN